MSSRDDDRFRVRLGPPKGRQPGGGQRFVSRVLREVNKVGAKPSTKPSRVGARSVAKLGRGHVAAQTAGRKLGPGARRVVIKARYVVLKQAGARSVETHLRYIEREGVDRDGGKGHAYGPTTDQADLAEFEERGRGDRHQFRFIVSPEDAQQLEDLRGYTRHLMTRMEGDLGTSLDWVAVDHWNTDNPHTHIVLRGRDQTGQDLIIARDYIAHGMRLRACELATEWLGPRTEREILEGLLREVDQERWTSLDRSLQQQAQQSRDGAVELAAGDTARQPRTLQIGRLQRLTAMGLAQPEGINRWRLRPDIEPTLRAMGERGDIVRTMQLALGAQQREMKVFTPGEAVQPVIGRVIGKGLADELQERGYLVLDGIDGRAHYVALPAGIELEQFPTGAIVEAHSAAKGHNVDKAIALLAESGIYRADHHLSVLRAQPEAGRGAQETVAVHVRRLEALRRVGIVERVAEDTWRVPADFHERARQHDAKRMGGVDVTLRSHLPIESQKRVIGATWLDRQLIGGDAGIADRGFGVEVRNALRQRTEFLAEQGLAELRGSRMVLSRNLLTTLRNRELAATGKVIEQQTGQAYQPAQDAQRVSGIYRRSVVLASGRYALLDAGKSFSLVPWREVIERRLGQQVSAVVRCASVTWQVGRNHGIAI